MSGKGREGLEEAMDPSRTDREGSTEIADRD